MKRWELKICSVRCYSVKVSIRKLDNINLKSHKIITYFRRKNEEMCEAVFAAFDAARKSHRLTLKQLEVE